MKAYRLYLLAVFTTITMLLSSCYSDRSSLPINTIEEVVVDTTAVGGDIYIGYLEELNLSPKVKYSNPDALSYTWTLTLFPDRNNVESEVISTSLDLKYQVNREISTGAYTLTLYVTDTSHEGLQYITSWKVYVQSSMIGGLLIADTPDGETTDLTYIKSPVFSRQYTGAERLYPNLLSSRFEGGFKGIARSMAYTITSNFSRPHVNQVWLNTTDGRVVRFNPTNYSTTGDSGSGLIVYKPEPFRINDMFMMGALFILDTSNGYYKQIAQSETTFTIPYNVMDEIEYASGAMCHSTSLAHYNTMAWYEEAQGRFRFLKSTGSEYAPAYQIHEYAASESFDPSNSPGLTAIACEIDEKGAFSSFLMKDKVSGKYAMYLLAQYQPLKRQRDPETNEWVVISPEIQPQAYAKYAVPEAAIPLLDAAVSVFFSKVEKENIMYIATSDALYALSYGMGDTMKMEGSAKYSIPSGEKITKAKLFIQGEYAAKADDFRFNKALQLPINLRGVIISSEKGSTGVVRVLPIDQDRFGSGDLLLEQVSTYEVQGKVLDVVSIGY